MSAATDKAVSDFKTTMASVFREIAEGGVQYAKDNGNYHDVTGNLRRSNECEADENGLVLKNTAEYASYVEDRGYDVISGAIQYIKRQLGK